VNKNTDTAFGFYYKIFGFIQGNCYKLTHRITHPPIIVPGKKAITHQERSFEICEKDVKNNIYASNYLWTFDREWEKKSGDWSMYLLYGDKILLNESFIVE